MHTERTRLDVNRSPNESIRSWTLGALKMTRKLKKHPKNDIQRYFNGQRMQRGQETVNKRPRLGSEQNWKEFNLVLLLAMCD